MSDKKYVFLVDDDFDLLLDIERILKLSGYIVHSFSNPQEFLSKFQMLMPAVLITDMRMPGSSGLELQVEFTAKGYKTPIIYISGESSDKQIIQALKKGAFDFLLKPFSREDLLSAVAKAIDQDTIYMQELRRKARLKDALKNLSPREFQVFELLTRGYGNKELIDTLGIALPTAKEYKSGVMQKLGLTSLSELIALSEALKGD